MESYEQKYKEALEWMQGMYGGLHGKTKEEAEKYFPELRESEDEKIRKALIENFKWFCGDFPKTTKWGKDDNLLVKDIITWLEKQGQPKWSDEDEERLQSCIIALQGKGLMGGVDTMDSKWLKSLKQKIHDSSAKTCKNDTLLDLLQKMPSCITVDGIDYHFVLKKTNIYTAYYKALPINSPLLPIFAMTAFSPIDLLTDMLEKLKEKGLLE